MIASVAVCMNAFFFLIYYKDIIIVFQNQIEYYLLQFHVNAIKSKISYERL